MIKKLAGIATACVILSAVCMLKSSSAAISCNEINMAGIGIVLDTVVESNIHSAVPAPEVSAPTEEVVSSEAPMAGAAGMAAEAVSDSALSVDPNATVVDPNAAVVDPNVAVDPNAAVVDPNAAAVDPNAAPAVPEVTPEPVSRFENLGISIAPQYVHVRKKPNTESKILGKLYKGSAARILGTKGDWVQIKSGQVTGYIKAEYLAIGFDAEKLVDTYGTKIATVTVTTLKVREEKNTECAVLTLVPEGEEFEVVKECDEWVKILVDDTTRGYVSKEYVKIKYDFKRAISIKQEREKLRRERERKEAIRRAEEERQRQIEEAAAAASRNNSSNKSSSSSSHKSNPAPKVYHTSGGTASSAASYAKNFVGNPYVYGGTSLTNGTDCSGFVQSIYSKYGVSLPRTSSSQASSGSSVSLSNVKAGDLIFYASNGHVNHVAMYIGNGQVVHASNRRDGIKISNMRYRTPCSARRVAN